MLNTNTHTIEQNKTKNLQEIKDDGGWIKRNVILTRNRICTRLSKETTTIGSK